MMRFLTHTRLTCTNEMNQSRETIYSPHKPVFADKMCQALSLMSSWSCGGRWEHPRARVMWQMHRSKGNKFPWVRAPMCIAVRGLSRILWFWLCRSVLLLSFVFCCSFLKKNFHLLVFSSCAEAWYAFLQLVNPIHSLMNLYICAHSPDHPDPDTQYSSSLEVESLFWIKEMFLNRGTFL